MEVPYALEPGQDRVETAQYWAIKYARLYRATEGHKRRKSDTPPIRLGAARSTFEDLLDLLSTATQENMYRRQPLTRRLLARFLGMIPRRGSVLARRVVGPLPDTAISDLQLLAITEFLRNFPDFSSQLYRQQNHEMDTAINALFHAACHGQIERRPIGLRAFRDS